MLDDHKHRHEVEVEVAMEAVSQLLVVKNCGDNWLFRFMNTIKSVCGAEFTTALALVLG